MEALFMYFVKICVASGVMFGYYQLFLKDKTFHHYNRFYLLSTFAVSLLLPLMKVEYFTVEQDSKLYLLLNGLQNFKTIKTLQDDFPYFRIVAISAGLGAVFFLIRFATGLWIIGNLKKKYPKQYFDGISFYQTDLSEAPFSFFKNLFWKRSIGLDSDTGKQILRHEMVHIKQKHSIDKVFAETITAVFWFNPFFWLIKKEINLIHEYLADKKALKNMDTKAFAQMLLASHLSGKVLPATSPFLNSNLKKRLTMLKKSKTKFAYARKILALPTVFLLAFAYLVNAKNKEIEESNLEIEQFVQKMKSDTVSPNESLDQIRSQINAKRKEIEPIKSAVDATNNEISALNKELSEKNKAVKKAIAENQTNTPEVQRLEKEMDELARKIDWINASKEHQNKIAELGRHYADMDKLYAGLEKMYASKEFQRNAKEHQTYSEGSKFLNSKEYNKMLTDAAKAAEDGRKAAAEAARAAEEGRKAAAEAAKEATKATAYANSAKFKKEVADAQKFEKEKDKFWENVQKDPIIGNNSTKTQDEQMLKMRKNFKEPKFYLDGKEISKKDLDAFDVQKIESINVEKKDGEGFIYIKSKR